jgi:hypothetical protein
MTRKRSSDGQLAQLVEQRIENPRVRGSIPRLATKSPQLSDGQLAQLVEQRIENPRVRGSIPRLATRIPAKAKLNAWLFALLRPLRCSPAATWWRV